MRVLCAPNAFKECLPAAAAAQAMASGVRQADPQAQIDLCPVADGGDGTVEALTAATAGALRHATVADPLGRPVSARWGTLGRQPSNAPSPTAIIEMAAASGLFLLPVPDRDPTRTTSFGTGQLIRAALDAGARRIILGIGGSATCDGGIGCLQALAVRFFDSAGHHLSHLLTGADLLHLARIDPSHLDPRLSAATLTIACDVTNPLTGPSGAAAVYAPQKGATPDQVIQLDAGLRHWAAVLRRDCGVDVENLPGAGAAGGLGAGLVACLGAALVPGVDLVLQVLDFDARVSRCNLCLTGEGHLDAQTLHGKACWGVAQIAARHGVPVVALVGRLSTDVQHSLSGLFAEVRVIGPGLSAAQSIRRAPELLTQASLKCLQSFQRR